MICLIYPQKNAVLSCEADFMQSLAGMEELKDSPSTISCGHNTICMGGVDPQKHLFLRVFFMPVRELSRALRTLP